MEHITLFETAEACCGCGACAAVCPQAAIQMQPDELGFLYPHIQHSLCVGCRKCLQVCTKQNGQQPILAYAAFGKNRELVENSASGGVFATLAKSCAEQGGMVAGAVMDWKHRTVCHVLSDKFDDITAMQGSKYMQSQAVSCYKAVKKALQAGKTVLFSGTPCQTAAIKKITGDPQKLVTVDLICHGVPSQQWFSGFLGVLEKRFGGVVDGFCFRDKKSPKAFTARIHLKKGSKSKTYRIRSHNLSFYQYFLEADSYRESCYSCPYAKLERVSDLTLGDYWGMEKHHPEAAQGQNWSCVLVNTEKGRSYLEQWCGELKRIPTEAAWVAETNSQLCQPSQKGVSREAVIKAYQKGGYPAVERLFIRQQGGSLRYHWRIYKAMRKMGK